MMHVMSVELSAVTYGFLGWVEENGFNSPVSPDLYTLRDLDEWMDEHEEECECPFECLDLTQSQYVAMRRELKSMIDEFGAGTPLSDHLETVDD